MAERQQPFLYSKDRIEALEQLLSRRRFATYLKAAGFRAEHAFELYLYNARLAKAFLFPLQVMEVLLRNAVDEVLSNRFTPDWHLDTRLRDTLTAESHATVNTVMRTRPVAAHAELLSIISDNDFVCLEQNATLGALVGRTPKFVISMENQIPIGAMDQADLGRYLLDNVDDTGLIDFGEHSIKEVLARSKGQGALQTVNQLQDINSLGVLLKGPGRFVLVVDASRKILGVISRTHHWS